MQNIGVQSVESDTQLTQVTKGDAVLFDVDGVLADNQHRLQYVKIKPKNWPAFFKAQSKDTIIKQFAHLARETYAAGKHKVIIFTARPIEYQELTKQWLLERNIPFHDIFMRDKGDNREDVITKKEMLDKVRKEGYNPIILFDDKESVIKMARDNGLIGFQVEAY